MKVYTCGVHSFHSSRRYEFGGIHPYAEILYLTTGSYKLEWLGSLTYDVTTPSLFLLPTNTLHRLRNQTDVHSFWYIGMTDIENSGYPELDEVLRWNQLQSTSQPPLVESSEIAATVHDLGITLSSDTHRKMAYFQDLLLCDLNKLVILIRSWLQTSPVVTCPSPIYRSDDPPQAKSAQELIRLVSGYMEDAFNQPLNINQLAAFVHLNPSYMIRLFKSVTGVTPMQYLTQLRMNAAVCYLSSSSMTIEEIAHRTGFASIHYFSTQFKRWFGESPSVWRNKPMSLTRRLMRVEGDI